MASDWSKASTTTLGRRGPLYEPLDITIDAIVASTGFTGVDFPF